jgi:hypothetical protein
MLFTMATKTNRSFVDALFYDEPAGTFSDGYIFRSAPDLTSAIDDPDIGYWHCDIADHDRLTWSGKVYELFGLPNGVPVERAAAVACYSEQSRSVLEQVRTFGLNRKFGFILDAEIRPKGTHDRWIRVLAVPILSGDQVVGLHGLKRAL